MTEAIWRAVWWFNGLVLAYFVILNLSYVTSSLAAFRSLRRHVRRLRALDLDDLLSSVGAPPITLIAPAYNEEATCVESVRSLLTLQYPTFEVVIVNDGSKDRTLARLTEAFDLTPADRMASGTVPTAEIRGILTSRSHRNLWVIDKANGGKADALNAGLNRCRTPLFCAIDADSILDRDALSRIVRPFLEDRTTIAAGGVIRIANGCVVRDGSVVEVGLPSSFLAQLQALEYLRAFLAGRVGWEAAGSTLLISGAFGLFRRDLVAAVGGYDTATVGEDMELVVRLHRYCLERGIAYRVAFVPDPAAWTECPTTLRVLRRQRDRWQRGLIETLVKHRQMLFRPRFGRIGMFAFPYYFFLEMLGPVIEAAGYAAFIATLVSGRGSSEYFTAFLLVAVVLGSVLSIAAVALEELSFHRYPKSADLARLIWLGVAENFGYRQLTMLWRLAGTFSALRGKHGWGKMERVGFTTSVTSALDPQSRVAGPALPSGKTDIETPARR